MREILGYYESYQEEARLRSGWGALELARTQELILRHLGQPARTVLDVGGAAGVYSEWLGSLGHEVHLVDAVPKHVVEARRACSRIASAEVGDARTLRWGNASFDAVLLMGPLYHLTGREERIAALREARRVLRPDGLIFAAAISRFASLFDGLITGCVDDAEFAPIPQQDLRDGQHRNHTGRPEFFTTAYLHQPEELRSEVLEAGFRVMEVVGIEGPVWITPDFEKRWNDSCCRERMLELARSVEHEPAVMGVSQHLLAIGRC
jgi:SAM-dependent methyltransferase